MKNLILTIGMFLLVLSTKSQVITYNAKEFYCFSVPYNFNPFVEFIKNREIEDEGHIGSVDYVFDDSAKTVTVNSHSYNTTTVYKMVVKDTSDKRVTKYIVRDGHTQFYFLVSKQSDEIVNLYCFWSEVIMNKGWQSVIRL
jgi:hypothetical protein